MRAGVGCSYFEVLLDEGCCGGCGGGLGVCNETEAGDVEDDDDDSRRGKGQTCVAALADANADKPERVDGGDDEGEAIGSGDGSEAGQQRIVDLGDAEDIPRESGDAGAGEFYGYPYEGDEQKDGLATEAFVEGGDQRSKQRVIETEVETEEDEDAGGDWLGEAAV